MKLFSAILKITIGVAIIIGCIIAQCLMIDQIVIMQPLYRHLWEAASYGFIGGIAFFAAAWGTGYAIRRTWAMAKAEQDRKKKRNPEKNISRFERKVANDD